MGALSLTSFSVAAPKKFLQFSNNDDLWLLMTKKKSTVAAHCQSGGGGGNERRYGGLPSILTKRLSATVASNGHGRGGGALMETRSLVLSKNGGPTAVEVDEEIGIVKFLSRKSFFITGATGFLAKVLIEKILRTAPDVSKIFILIRAKSKEAAMQRLQKEIIQAELFKCLQQNYGKSYEAFMLSKLVPVVGNACESNLGLEEYAVDAIAREVDVIVNSAANITFDERYDVALDINTGGCSQLISFAKKCQKLKLFLHVSTAYVNGHRQGKVMEKPLCMEDSIARENLIFETPKTPLPTLRVEDELKLVFNFKKTLDGNEVAQKMKELGLERAKVHGWQDTYAFTKAMGEMLIHSMTGEIPIVIVRPSIIESTYKEPFPGWIEGSKVMDPIILYYGKGQLTGFLADPNAVLDVVPVDVVVNATLAAIAKHGAIGKAGNNIYQIASSVVNPLVIQDLNSFMYHHFKSAPLVDSKGRAIEVSSTVKLFSSMEDLSSHLSGEVARRRSEWVAAMASPPNGKLFQKFEKIWWKSMEQAKHLASIYQPYTFYGGRFDISNTKRLMECLSKEEREEFGFEVENIDWKDYISNVHIPGLRKHVMKGRGMHS